MKNVKKILKIIVKILLLIIALILLYLLMEKILSNYTINDEAHNTNKQIPMYIKSNGVHTDLVFEKKNNIINWDTIFPLANNKFADTTLNYVAIGWGDKGFYLNTPEWKDLKFSTAFNAMFGLSTTALHVTYYSVLDTNELTKYTTISEQEYKSLINYIIHSSQLAKDKPILIVTDAQYGNNDAFYEANEKYTLFKTCNTWTNNALKVSNLKACKWTAFDSGILNAYE